MNARKQPTSHWTNGFILSVTAGLCKMIKMSLPKTLAALCRSLGAREPGIAAAVPFAVMAERRRSSNGSKQGAVLKNPLTAGTVTVPATAAGSNPLRFCGLLYLPVHWNF